MPNDGGQPSDSLEEQWKSQVDELAKMEVINYLTRSNK